jgi:preprotein translocase subunit YajC
MRNKMTIDQIIKDKNINIKLGDLIVSTSGQCAIVSEVEENVFTLDWNSESNPSSKVQIDNVAIMVHFGKWQINPA